MTSHATSCLWQDQIGGVRVDVDKHITGVIADGCVLVHVHIVEHGLDFFLRSICDLAWVIEVSLRPGNREGSIARA